MKILVTGAAGFLGFSFVKKLLISKKFQVLGIDNFDSYYTVKLKKQRINILNKNKNFTFKKIDIIKKKELFNFLKKKNFDFVFHFAAQAGVRHVTADPKKYLDVNISGFFNVLQYVIKSQPKKFFYASSSSVYGDTDKFPTKESAILRPKNIYGLSKKFNEELISVYSGSAKTKFIGLRFFTLYGEWGRPDMLLIKFMISSLKKKFFKIHNYGNYIRDFTYIDDAVSILEKLMLSQIKSKHLILNICSSKPLLLSDVIKKMIELTKFNLVQKISAQKVEVVKTFGSNKKLLKLIGNFKFSRFDDGLKKTYLWFIKNKRYLIN